MKEEHSSNILDKIKSPCDLKALTESELKQVACEIRSLIVEVVSKNGGHLAPSLGVVELTIGIHRALNCPADKLVWDVGHQSYAHKILTGRKNKFHTIRKLGGLSGFPKRGESKYDVHDAGHASSSIGIALGLAKARDLKGQKHKVVAVIGDGALTGGVAFEALNQAGHDRTNLVIVVNDNERSIAGNVGALSTYLSQIRLDPTYNRIRSWMDDMVKKIPKVGEMMFSYEKQLRDGFKHMFVPGMIFEELGFKYFGPIDGHDVAAVENSIKLACMDQGPVIIHALTVKGKGYEYAERDCEKFHGIGAFDVKKGTSIKLNQKPTYTEVFGDSMVELGVKNKNIVAITAAMTSGTGLTKFAGKFKDRFFDVGIAEQEAVTFGAGLALGGKLPVIAIYSTFLERAYDQIIQDVCLENLPVIFAIDRAGIVGEDGPTHHGVFDISYLRAIPNMVVMSPKDENELRNMLHSATSYKRPVAIRYPRGFGEGVKMDKQPVKIDIGEGEVLREGRQVLMIAVGRMVSTAVSAAGILAEKGIQPTVVNARFIKPLPEELITQQLRDHKLVVTLEENALQGGFGSSILEILSDYQQHLPVLRLGIPDDFVEHGTSDEILASLGLSSEAVAWKIESAFKQASRSDTLSSS